MASWNLGLGTTTPFHLNHRTHGTIERYNAYLTVRGYRQILDIDFTNTLNIVVKITIVHPHGKRAN